MSGPLTISSHSSKGLLQVGAPSKEPARLKSWLMNSWPLTQRRGWRRQPGHETRSNSCSFDRQPTAQARVLHPLTQSRYPDLPSQPYLPHPYCSQTRCGDLASLLVQIPQPAVNATAAIMGAHVSPLCDPRPVSSRGQDIVHVGRPLHPPIPTPHVATQTPPSSNPARHYPIPTRTSLAVMPM